MSQKNGQVTTKPETERALGAIQSALASLRAIEQERLELEDRLRHERDFAKGIFDAAQVIILVLDRDCKIVTFNPYMEEIAGCSVVNVEGQSWLDLFVPVEDHDYMRALLCRVLETPDVVKGSVGRVISGGGEILDIEWNSAALRNDGVSNLLLIGVDISDRARLEHERVQLERRKYQFMANVSHELRTPLALIKGYAALMVGDDSDFSDLADLTPEQKKIMRMIVSRAEDLARLVDDILTIQELADPQALIFVQAGEVSVAAVCRALAESFMPVVESKGLQWECHLSEDPAMVAGSNKMIGRAITNLLWNAVKFTDAGVVGLGLELQGGQVIVRVSDTGIGISPEEHEAIFERFYQVNGSSTRSHGGSGIGLTVVREITEAHGGHVELESALGAGSTFSLYLPLLEPGDKTDVLTPGPGDSG